MAQQTNSNNTSSASTTKRHSYFYRHYVLLLTMYAFAARFTPSLHPNPNPHSHSCVIMDFLCVDVYWEAVDDF
ncbi:hypothetical protein L208DRAFT_1391319 [Tricholoma matsutake]|nr:hypothetical protein L208DRAFT_1391319 [Tricholoma matsutake 945]